MEEGALKFSQVKEIFKKYSDEMEKQEQEKINNEVVNQFTIKKMQSQNNFKIQQLEGLLGEKDKIILELEFHIKRMENEEADKNKRQMRKYIEILNEKEAELNNLRKQNTNYKTKISNMESEIITMASSKENMENFVVKNIEGTKSNLKELSNNMDEIETEKNILESKYKQSSQKLDMLLSQFHEIEIKKKSLEESYFKIKEINKDLSNELLEMKFEMEKNRFQKIDPTSIQLPKSQSFNLISEEILKEIQKIKTLSILLKDAESMAKQVQSYAQMNSQLIEENIHLKEEICLNQKIIDDLRSQFINGYEDQLLLKKNPSLFEYLMDKKEKIQDFQTKLDTIERFIESNDQSLKIIQTNILNKWQNYDANLVNTNPEELDRKNQEILAIKNQLSQVVNQSNDLKNQNQLFREEIQVLRTNVSAYKIQILEMVAEDKKPNKNKKKKVISRCMQCLISISKNEKSSTCSECNKIFHINCFDLHICGEQEKKEDTCSLNSAMMN